nr:ATP-binding protein [Butyrivibrio sp.]
MGNESGNTEKRKKWTKVIFKALQFIIWLALTRLCVYSTLHGENMTLQFFGELDFAFILFPYLLLGGLYGYVISFVSFLISFTCAILFEMETAYCMAVFLAATTCFALFSQYFFFKTIKKTLIASFITLLVTSSVEFWCVTVLAASDFNAESIKNYPLFLIKEILTIFGIAFILYLFYTKASDIIKMIFPIGAGYTSAYQKDEEIQRSVRKTKISIKITAIIIGIELMLGLAVSVFMIALFPDMKDMMVNNIKDHRQEVVESSKENEEDGNGDITIKYIQNMNFVMDHYVLTYDIKMVLLMLCVGVPLGGIANFYIKFTVGGPLGVLSDFMYEYSGADDEQKLLVGKKVDKIRTFSKDEILVVAQSTKEMVHSIEDYIERTRQEQQLKLDLEVAQKASEAKSSFLSNMSHEIRTPINAVLGMNEMILRENNDPQIEEYAQNVKSAGNSLLGIVNDILDFSKIEAGKMDILNVEYHLSSMVNDLLNMISVKAEDKGLEVIVNVDEKTPDKLFGDEVRIKQCVTNILTNAVKYTEKGSVTLNVGYRKSEEDDEIYLKFQVVDTGIGIKEEDLSKLFSPFERIEEIRNRTIEGTGLGMSIVKKLLALMDTKLVVESEYGKGSDFSFEVKQKVVSAEEIGDFKEKYKLYLKSLKKYHESFTAPDAGILVVDDTAINLTVVKGLLKSTLVKVDTAESGKETLALVTKKKYDAIFIDHRMPEMDGIETLAAMKELEGNLNTDTPCIALTANAGSGARDEYIAAGFDDYLSKPVDGKVLERMLMEYLPKEKVRTVSQTDAPVETNEPEMSAAVQDSEDFLSRLEDIDLNEALTNCGSREILMDVVKEFLISIDKKSGDIESFANNKDFRNYTVSVHALKSSARLIGAMQLSKDAAYLEKCGNEENAAEIDAKTPDLLALYRSYKVKLSAANEEGASDEDKEPIPEDELESAFSDMKELLEAYDFDTADGIMDMLDTYKIPDSKKEKFLKIKELMAAVDRDALLELL